jgi:hypothetical protein
MLRSILLAVVLPASALATGPRAVLSDALPGAQWSVAAGLTFTHTSNGWKPGLGVDGELWARPIAGRVAGFAPGAIARIELPAMRGLTATAGVGLEGGHYADLTRPVALTGITLGGTLSTLGAPGCTFAKHYDLFKDDTHVKLRYTVPFDRSQPELGIGIGRRGTVDVEPDTEVPTR